ncbi:hypothetical protein OG271_30325 [Micromonospora rifamycinica]|uniref:hypothetical protein n=1 Tax=Micromonospora rifamycinica TaxID=291594 RepID=UPI002E2B2ADE|nr:hypothetical protein [Micromonospora rifamycinica]
MHALFVEPLGPVGLDGRTAIARTILDNLEDHHGATCSLREHGGALDGDVSPP